MSASLINTFLFRNHKPLLIAAVGLTGWCVMANLVYVPHTKEYLSTDIITAVFITYAFAAGFMARHWVFIWLVVAGVATANLEAETAFRYKELKNALYLSCWIALWVSYLSGSGSRVSRWDYGRFFGRK